MDKESPILARIFKEEAELEIWKKNRNGEYALLKTFPICRWSGDLGPKKKEGDRQAPEGFYTITPAQMNPNSNYYLAFNTGYPNAFDRAWGRTGSELMVHGDCSSRGCYAMTDEQIQEIYALARESFFGGQKEFQFQAFPFRMTALNMAKHRNNPNFAFWKEIKEGYDHFEATHQEPKVAVCEKHYVFDAVAPENASQPLKFDARGKCPVYQLDPTIADAVLDHRRQEQFQMASYIARDVSLAPPHVGDGGMNPVFASKLGTQEEYDTNGHLIRAATAPGALPRTPNPPAMTAQARRPVKTASVPMPQPAPQAKEGEAPPEKPKSIASLIGNWFSGSNAGAKPAEAADSQPVVLRGVNTNVAARQKPVQPVHTASASHAKPPEATTAEPKTVAKATAKTAPAPSAQPSVQQASKDATPPAPAAPELRTAYSTTPPPASNGGLLAGAQPVVPAGSFESRWTALR